MRRDRARGKGSLVLEKRDSQPSVKGKVEEQTNKPQRTFLKNIDAIAQGVEAWYEIITDHSRRVVEVTEAIARKLGVPKDEIETWAALRLIRDTEKVRLIKSLLERLWENPPDQADNKRQPRRTIASDPA